MRHDEYPKWVKVDGKGHPQNPGHVLVENEDQERDALATGEGPRELNPPRDEDVPKEPVEVGRADGTVEIANEPAEDKPLAEQSRKELIDTLVRETITDEVEDDHLRSAIEVAREHGGKPSVFDRDGSPEAFEPSGKPVDEMDREELINTVLDRAINSEASDADLRFVIMVLDGDVRDEPDDAHEEHGHARETKEVEPLTDAAGDKIPPDPAAEANKGDTTKPAPGAPAAKSAPATDATPKEGKDKVADDKPAGNVTEAAATPPDHKKGAAKPAGKK